MILRVSTRPIVKRIERTRCLRRTNWEGFKRKIETRMEHTFDCAEMETKTDIDAGKIEKYYGHWYKAIEDSLEETSPTTKISFYLHAGDSDFLRLLEITYRGLTTKPFWTRDDIELLRNIQQRIREENLRLYREEWEKKIENLDQIHKDSSKFWGGAKKLIGNARERQEYIMDPQRQNVKVYKPEDKEVIYRNTWEKIFSIPPEDNVHFDQENEGRVMTYLNNNEDIIKPYRYADLSRLDRNSYLTTPFKTSDVII